MTLKGITIGSLGSHDDDAKDYVNSKINLCFA